ncbi:MAG: DNA repair protein RecN [Chlamydiae bacterium]|nr:DNA repair protein RecN [Chlamydiota bacterium]
MLKELYIKNVILIDSAQVSFGTGLHIFSGETGAGKTAILHALRLILGAKADTQLIRNGEEKATVSALFDLKDSTLIFSVLSRAGIEVDPEGSLIIKREVTAVGKSRAYINNQPAQVGLLKQISPFLMEVVAQHASQKLLDPDYHREIIDTFGQHSHVTQNVMESYFHLSSLKAEYKELLNKEENEKTLKKQWSAELEEIEAAQVESLEEDESLFQDYEKLTHTKELYDTLSKSYDVLQERDASVLDALKAELLALNKINISSSEFKNIQIEFESIIESLNELSFSVLHFRDSLEENPERIHEIDERLKLLRSLCKRYGPTLQDVINKQEKLSFQLNQFEEITEQKESLHKQIEDGELKFRSSCDELTRMRKLAQGKLQKQIQTLLNELNLPNAELVIEFNLVKPSATGQESIEFFLKANVGENKAALKDRVSGGELSRLLLALKVILSDLEDVPTLFFDEVDANLGGETAPKIGKLLKKMSQNKQIVVITHLPQVAAYADQHFQIQKEEEENRTFSLIKQLNQKQKQKEIERMLGGKSLSKKASELASDLLQSSKS